MHRIDDLQAFFGSFYRTIIRARMPIRVSGLYQLSPGLM